MTGRSPMSLTGQRIEPWNGIERPQKRRQDPETCHCGKPALYRHPTKHNVGYCKEHKADAEKVMNDTKHRSER
jgi:hypothetical protein